MGNYAVMDPWCNYAVIDPWCNYAVVDPWCNYAVVDPWCNYAVVDPWCNYAVVDPWCNYAVMDPWCNYAVMDPWCNYAVMDPWCNYAVMDPWCNYAVMDPWCNYAVMDPWCNYAVMDPWCNYAVMDPWCNYAVMDPWCNYAVMDPWCNYAVMDPWCNYAVMDPWCNYAVMDPWCNYAVMDPWCNYAVMDPWCNYAVMDPWCNYAVMDPWCNYAVMDPWCNYAVMDPWCNYAVMDPWCNYAVVDPWCNYAVMDPWCNYAVMDPWCNYEVMEPWCNYAVMDPWCNYAVVEPWWVTQERKTPPSPNLIESESDGSNVESDDEHSGESLAGSDECQTSSTKESDEKLAAVGLCVGVGSFSDPSQIPGMAHFLEHMVFMGSEKYPQENDFDAFLTKRGGTDNASTDYEHTTFNFECQEKHLEEAMDRFSQFFICPLMKREAMQREREAIESEFEGFDFKAFHVNPPTPQGSPLGMNNVVTTTDAFHPPTFQHKEFQMAVPSDAYRKQQILCSLAQVGHPINKFTWGNLKTLKDNVTDDQLYSAVHEFRQQHYSSHRMTLAVQVPFQRYCLWEEWIGNIGKEGILLYKKHVNGRTRGVLIRSSLCVAPSPSEDRFPVCYRLLAFRKLSQEMGASTRTCQRAEKTQRCMHIVLLLRMN
uniref:Peptidase M16 N-terminal domain-containing protein n=1 Tax=Timema cristinae TaxID=61476 RepID=A0A7R9D685_TIMCR|nr:unnamed protein product [Timema cristinae]